MKPLRAASLALLLLPAACGAPEKTTVLVYSAHGKDLLGEVEGLFEKEHPGADLVWLDLGADQCFDRVRGEAANPQADLWWGGPEYRYTQAAEAGWLEPYQPTWADKVPAASHDAQWRWAGCFSMPQVIAFHADLVKDPPKDWADLADPKWKGRVILRDPAQSGGMKAVLGAMCARDAAETGEANAGLAWFRAVAANRHSIAPNPARLFDAFRRDDTGLVTIWNLTDVLFQSRAADPRVPFAWTNPSSGAPTFTDGIALVARGSRKPNPAAAAFYEFATSPAITAIFAERHYRLPVRTDVPQPSWAAGLELRPMPVDWSVVGRNVDAWQRAWEDALQAPK